MPISKLKIWLSYLFPITVRKGRSNEGLPLHLILSNGQWQLSTKAALYSDGLQYRPMDVVYKRIQDRLPHVANMLFLGAGIGSGLLMYEPYGKLPKTDVVEYEPVIIAWLKELLPPPLLAQTNIFNLSAEEFAANNRKQYDLIISDVFIGREVPAFAAGIVYLQNLSKALTSEGILAINYIVNKPEEHEQFIANVASLGLRQEVISKEQNRIVLLFKA